MKKLLLLIAITFISITSTFATHLISAEITYIHQSGNNYEVTLTVYTDCSGINFPQTQTLNTASTSCMQSLNYTLPLIQTTDASQVCPGQLTTCNGGTLPGVNKNIYRGIVTLTPCSDWILSWNSCCRNPSITNLVNPNTQAIYVQNTLNNVVGSNNNSPQYSSTPVPYLAVNNLTTFNHGTTDVDGDSLYYSLITPLTTPGPPGTPILYNPGYAVNQPVLTTSGFNFNQLNGDMCFTPSQNQISIVSTLIEEFRNGVLIGSQIRELQVIASNYLNQLPNSGTTPVCGTPPTLSLSSSGASVTQIDGNSLSMCAGDNFCFQISPTDPDGDNITISSNIISAIPGATFTVANNNTTAPVATICWNSTTSDSGLKDFTVTLTDNSCPIIGIQILSYDVLLINGVAAGLDQTICGAQTAQLNATNGTGYTWFDANTNIQIPVGPAFSCNPCSNPIASPNVTTDYYVLSSLPGNCSVTDTVTVSVAPTFTADVLGDTVLCGAYQTPLNINILTGPPGTYTYSWDNAGTLNNPNIQNPIASPMSSIWYTPTITSPLGCSLILDSAFVEIVQTPTTYQNFSICQGDSILIVGSYQNIANTYYDTLSSINGCDSVIESTLTILNYNAGFTYTDNGSGNYTFTNTSTGGYSLSDWSFGDGNTSSLTNPSHTFITDGTYTVVLSIADSSILNGGSCIQYVIDTITVSNVGNNLQCNAGYVLYPDTASTNLLVINNSIGSNLTYLWDFGDGNTSTLQNPSHTYAGSGPYALCLTIDDGNGCTDSFCDSVTTNGVAFKGAGFTINVISTPINTGINKVQNDLDYSIQPNPNNGLFSIYNLHESNEPIQVKIMDISSKIILEKNSKDGKIDIDLRQYGNGIYFVRIISNNHSTIKRIIKN